MECLDLYSKQDEKTSNIYRRERIPGSAEETLYHPLQRTAKTLATSISISKQKLLRAVYDSSKKFIKIAGESRGMITRVSLKNTS